jgi:hypothetical protein
MGTENVHNIAAELNVLVVELYASLLKRENFHGHLTNRTEANRLRTDVLGRGRPIADVSITVNSAVMGLVCFAPWQTRAFTQPDLPRAPAAKQVL